MNALKRLKVYARQRNIPENPDYGFMYWATATKLTARQNRRYLKKLNIQDQNPPF